MFMTRLAAWGLACVLTQASTASQQQSTPQRDAEGFAVLEQSMAAASFAPTGATGANGTLARGSISWADGRSGSITIESKGASLRHEISLPGQQIVHVISAGQGYSILDGNRTPLPLWITKYQRSEHIPALSRIADYTQPNTNIAYLGVQDVNGNPAHHIRLSSLPMDSTPQDLEDRISEFHVYIDVNSSLVLKTLGFLFSPEAMENRSTLETYYSDYRRVGSFLVPFHMSRFLSGHKYCEITFTSVDTAVTVPDSDFQ